MSIQNLSEICDCRWKKFAGIIRTDAQTSAKLLTITGLLLEGSWGSSLFPS